MPKTPEEIEQAIIEKFDELVSPLSRRDYEDAVSRCLAHFQAVQDCVDEESDDLI